MDILWALLTLPYAPVRGLTSVVKVVAREAESRQHDPVDVRRELEALDAAAAAGEISAAERDRGQQQVLERLTGGVRRPARGRSPARNGPGSRRGNERVRRVPYGGGEGGERDGGSDPRRRRSGA